MRNRRYVIGIFFILALSVFLFSFSAKRNKAQQVNDVLVDFTNPKHPYIAMESVYDLLEIKKDSLTKEVGQLDIGKLEAELRKHPMVEEAEVYVTIDAMLGASVTQRTPVARYIQSDDKVVYLDRLGEFMPLSDHYSARVPLVYGIRDSLAAQDALKVLLEIRKDEFLNQSLVALDYKNENRIKLNVRQNRLDIWLGDSEDLDEKLYKLKRFLAYLETEATAEEYKAIDLQYNQQVVATKK